VGSGEFTSEHGVKDPAKLEESTSGNGYHGELQPSDKCDPPALAL